MSRKGDDTTQSARGEREPIDAPIVTRRCGGVQTSRTHPGIHPARSAKARKSGRLAPRQAPRGTFPCSGLAWRGECAYISRLVPGSMALLKTEIRIQVIGLVFLLGISAIIAKLWWVQVVRGDYYTQKIRGAGEVTVRIPSVRGEIMDRNGVKLVTNRASYSVEFFLNDMVKGYAQAFGKSKVPKLNYVHTVKGVYAETKEADVVKIVNDTVLPRLRQLGIHEDFSAKELQKHYRTDTLVPFTYMEDIKFSDMAKLSERDLGLPGVDLPERPVREYPYGALAAHILGYVGQADTDDEDAKKFTYYQADVEGKNNVELYMDKWLRGEPGVRYVKKNAKGVIEGDIGERPPVAGDDVYLTIDARVQTIAEEALRVVGRGAAIVADPYTGNILAMASVPSFDPNTFIPSISTEDWNKLIKDDTNPLTNRAILSYAPGSTFKTITSLAGLICGKGNNKYTCTGGVTYGGKYMHCWIGAKGGSHGTLDLEGGLKNSCNAYFFQYGNAAGVDNIDKVAALVGIGQKTNIGLTNEASGVLPGKQWLADHYPKDHWSDGHTANLSIGQGYVQCSPLQMSMIASMFANGGTCYYPRLIDRVVDRSGQDAVDPDTGKLVATGPRVRCNLGTDLGLKPDQVERVRRGMWKVVNEAGGTAPRAKIPGVEVAGKTGTAEFWRNGVKDNHTWFICFAPYQKPKYAVCVFIQGAKGGAVTAAPIATRILEELFALDAGTYKPDVKPLTPAKGSFAFINNVDFTAPIPVNSGPDAAAASVDGKPVMAEGDEAPPPSDEHESGGDHNTDHDRVKAAAPKLREKPEPSDSGSSAPAEADANGNIPKDSPLMKSLRNFFRRGDNGDTSQDPTQTLQAQQKTLRKQQKAQQRQQQASSNAVSPAQTPAQPPKRKKFLGIF